MNNLLQSATPVMMFLAACLASQTASADTYQVLHLYNPAQIKVNSKEASGRLLIYTEGRDPRKALDLRQQPNSLVHLAAGEYFLQFLPEGLGGFSMDLMVSHDTHLLEGLSAFTFHAAVRRQGDDITISQEKWLKQAPGAKYEFKPSAKFEGTRKDGAGGGIFLWAAFPPAPKDSGDDGLKPPPGGPPSTDGDDEDTPKPPPYGH